MRKLNLALLLTSFSLLIASCQKSSDVASNNNATDNTQEGKQSGSSNTDNADNADEKIALVEIHCDDGCLVRMDDNPYTKDFVQYVDYSAAKAEEPVVLNFNFQKLEDYYDFPTISGTIDGNAAVEGDTKDYTYDRETGDLTIRLDSATTYGNVIFTAFTDPAVEVTFTSDMVTTDFAFTFSGSLTAIDFGPGNVYVGPDIFNPVEPGIVHRPVVIDQTTHIGKAKVYGNCTNISLLRDCKGNELITEIKLNHTVNVFDFDLLCGTKLPNIEKIYIGPDVTRVNYPAKFDSEVQEGTFTSYKLREVTVSPDNRYFDSRDNCKCLINSASNKLLLGGSDGFIPDGVKTIAMGAFALNQGINYIELPDSLTAIEGFSFAFSSVSYLEMSSNLKTIENYAFAACLNLMFIDFSEMEHAPQMSTRAFEDSYIMTGSYDSQKIKTFLHYDIPTLNTIGGELVDIDYNWNTVFNEKFPDYRVQIPSAIVINKVNIGADNEEMQVDFNGEDNFNYSTATVLDPASGDETSTWSEWTMKMESSTPLIRKPFSYVQMGKFQYRSSVAIAIHPILSGTTEHLGNVALNFYNIKADPEPTPYYDNADTITFVKYFGNYAGNVIESSTFKDLHSLKDVRFSNVINTTVEQVGILMAIRQDAFRNTDLHKIELPGTLMLIDIEAFANCPNVREIVFNEEGRTQQANPELLTVGSRAFMNCKGVKSIYLPWFVTFDYDKACKNVGNPFTGCTSLESIECASDSTTCIIDEYGNLLSKDLNKLVCCTNTFNTAFLDPMMASSGFYTTLKSPYIVAKAFDGDSFSEYAFAYSDAETIKIVLAESAPDVTCIYNYAFAYCDNLKVLDLTSMSSSYKPLQFRGDPSTLLEGTLKPGFKVRVKADDKQYYKESFGFTDDTYIETVI